MADSQAPAPKSANRNPRAGVFVSFEGGEGSGKTTQVARLARRLEAEGWLVRVTREPGGTRLGEAIRQLLVREGTDPPVPLAELLLYAADRAHHVSTVLRPALEAGRAVLCDRYADATEAYQGWGRGLAEDLIRSTNALATAGLRPDRTLILDLEPALGIRRALDREGRSGDRGGAEARFEAETFAFHERVRAGYRTIAAREPERARLVDASGTPEEVAARVWETVKDLFE
jgi:dTMP kinase